MKTGEVRLLYGEEPYLINQRIESILTEMRSKTTEEPEYLVLDGERLQREQLREALENASLFAHFRVILIRRPPWFGKPGSKAARKLGEVEETLLQYFEHPSPFQVVVMTAEKINNSNRLVKALKSKKAVEELKKLSRDDLRKWVTNQFQQRGLEAEAAVINRLVGSNWSMFQLHNEIEKLSLYLGQRKATMSRVAELLEDNQEINIFRLTDALLARNTRAAQNALQQLFIQGQPPVLTVYMISRQFLQMARAKGWKENGCSAAEIGSNLKIRHQFIINKLLQVERSFSWDDIAAIFQYLLEADTALKSTGQNERLVLEMLAVNICQAGRH